MKQFYDSIKDKKIVIFGTGAAARDMTYRIPFNVEYYVDNDSTKWNSLFMGKKVYSPQVLLREPLERISILIASMYYKEISNQLQQMGFREEYDFFSALDMFINPLKFDREKVIGHEINCISTKLNKMMMRGHFKDAENLLLKYEVLIPFDERIDYFKALIALAQGNLEEVKQFIIKGNENSSHNLNLNYDFNIARKHEENKQYLKAMGIYEDLLELNDTNKFKNRIVNNIENIEKNHKDDIYGQLIESVNHFKNSKKIERSYNLHFMFDHFHNKKFIEFINNNYNEKDHVFLVFYYEKEQKYLEENYYSNVITIKIEEVNKEKIATEVQEYIYHSKKVIIHYLRNFLCWLIYKCNVNKELLWVIWGADLYSYIDIDLYDDLTTNFLNRIGYEEFTSKIYSTQAKIQNILRKSSIRKISHVLTWNKGDYDLFKDNFITSASYKEFFYPNPVDFKLLDLARNRIDNKYNFKHKYKYVFLLGNSADPTNNHLQILHSFKKFKNEDFCVIMPLSYSGNQLYTEQLIIEGEKLLGDKFIPLTEFLNPEEYAKILNQVDIAIMNHNRQQGAGNILALLYLGKKVYIKSITTTFKTFNKLGIKMYTIKAFQNSSFEKLIQIDNNIQVENSKKVLEAFNEKRLKENYDKLFD